MTAEQFQELTQLLGHVRRPLSAYFIPAIATLIAVAAASFFAWRQINNQRDLARMRLTYDLIIKMEADEYYQKRVQSYRLFRGEDLTADDIINPKAPDRVHSERFSSFLNYHEVVALGVAKGIIDKDLFRDWWGHTSVAIWNRSADLIRRLRTDRGNPNIMVQFETLARDYARDLSLDFIDLGARGADQGKTVS